MWAGLVIVVLCALVFALVTQRLGNRHDVLALSRSVPAGHVLSAADLRSVSVTADEAAGLVGGGDTASVVGTVLLTPLREGTLIQRSFLGTAEAFPPIGHAVVAIPVKQGGLPALRSGLRVAVVEGRTDQAGGVVSSGAPDNSPPVVGTVLAVEPLGDNSPGTVVSLLVETAAGRVVTRLADPRVIVLPPTTNEVP